MKYNIVIGIDTGTYTGIAVWDCNDKRFVFIDTVKIHDAFKIVEGWSEQHKERLFVRFEDARRRKWFGNAGIEQLQGAGSIKRDSAIWQDFLTSKKINFEPVPPKNNKTKLSNAQFKQITGYGGRLSQHGRDAAMLVFGM